MGHVQTSYLIPASRARVFEYVRDLERLTYDLSPAFEVHFGPAAESDAATNSAKPTVAMHAEIPLTMKRFGVAAQGVIRIERCVSPTELVYSQKSGWFRSWRHSIELQAHSEGEFPTTLVSDLIDYRLPLGVIGTLADDLFLKHDLRRILRDRALRITAFFETDPKAFSPQSNSDIVHSEGESVSRVGASLA